MIRFKHNKNTGYLIIYSDRRKFIINSDGGKCGSVHIPLSRLKPSDLIGYSESEDSVYDYADSEWKREELHEEYGEYDSLPDYKEDQ